MSETSHIGGPRISMADPESLEPFHHGILQVVVETPRGSRNKYSWDAERHCFHMKKVLPSGAVFPYDFGFVPGTRGGDGDPLDALLLMDEPAFPGCVLNVRLIGALAAEDTLPDGTVRRNDRLLCVAEATDVYADIRTVDDLPERLRHHLVAFFESYPKVLREKDYRVLAVLGPEEAMLLVEASLTSPSHT